MANHIIIKPNGPLIACGEIKVISSNGETLEESDEVFLCRCGATQNPPFCDGSHKTVSFTDNAEFTDEKTEPLQNDGPLVISVRDNAMLIAKGPVTINNLSGSAETTRNKAALCRCGASTKKPFCDSSHKLI